MLPSRLGVMNIGHKLHKIADVITSQTDEELYWRLITHWRESDQLVLGVNAPNSNLSEHPRTDNFIHFMMALDLQTYLPDDILCKVDRAAMGVSLETRVPFLDHRVVEFAWKLPLNLKLRNGDSKWILREVLYRHVPKTLIDRPKMGFAMPIDRWLRGPLRDWTEDMLSEAHLRQEGYLNPVPIRQKLAEHLSGKRSWEHHLWDILMFEAWLQEQQT